VLLRLIGKHDRIRTAPEGTSSVTVRASFPNAKHEILPGMFVRAVLEEGTRENALLVPQQAVTRDPVGNATALVLTAEGVVEQRKLTIDRSIDNQWLVRDGIKDGEQVIVEGGQRLKAGDKAQATSSAAASSQSTAAAKQ
ncbi:MAG: HlyD family secretion protein, partial [Polyangiaceae bacterium]